MTRCGIDLVEVARIQQSAEKNPRFVTRVFGDLEQELFQGASRYQRMAANFAAKEAFSKALGTGLRGFRLTEVQVLRDEWGAPFFQLNGAAAEKARGLCFSVSLTHTREYAQAFVLAEETEKGGMDGC